MLICKIDPIKTVGIGGKHKDVFLIIAAYIIRYRSVLPVIQPTDLLLVEQYVSVRIHHTVVIIQMPAEKALDLRLSTVVVANLDIAVIDIAGSIVLYILKKLNVIPAYKNILIPPMQFPNMFE